jgi:preprotein translocase subunit YajC
LWAQASGAAASGGKPAEATGTAQGAPEGQQQQGGGGLFGGGWTTIIMLVLMVAVFYFLLIRPQQKKAKEHQKMIDSIGKGTEVVTNGGLIGRVSAVTGKTLTMEISEKVRVRVLRSQVAGIYDSGETEKK